jgi:hypothetical protein
MKKTRTTTEATADSTATAATGSAPEMTIDNVERQKRYVEEQREKRSGLGIVFADAFLRGMRDLGYKNPAWALAEQVDNSFQGGATTVAVRLGYAAANKTQSRPDYIAVCDNGNGMIPEMISYAVRWGGTDREGDRKGFGRYGYGLPSSAVSIAKRYTVYSKTAESTWHAVTVDIDALADAAGDVPLTAELLTARPAEIPQWVIKGTLNEDQLAVGEIQSGTVIVLEDIDRLKSLNGWILTETLKTKLLQHFGLIYRHWLPARKIYVGGLAAQAIDPLFLMEHARFYDETVVHAQAIETRTVEMETSRGTVGKIKIRASFLPPDFQLTDPKDYRPDSRGSDLNSRFPIMRANNGLIVCREQRQIDVVSPRWTKFQNNDVNIKIEIDFDPELDEYFGITTAKQQIVFDDSVWEKLQHSGRGGGGLKDLVQDLRARLDASKAELDAEYRNRATADAPAPPASVLAMEESEKFKPSTPSPSPSQQLEGRRNLEKLASQRAAVTGEAPEVALEAVANTVSGRKWSLALAAVPEGPFYRPTRLGDQKQLVINTDHPFYSRVYAQAPAAQSALEVLLLVLAERELEAQGDAEIFYKAERQAWSERLRHALNSLTTSSSLADAASAVSEQLFVTLSIDSEAAA